MSNVRVSNPVKVVEAVDTFELDGQAVQIVAKGNVNVSKGTFSISTRLTTKTAPYELESREVAISSVAAVTEAAVSEAWRLIEKERQNGPDLFSQPAAGEAGN
jgi:hypothetical protein